MAELKLIELTKISPSRLNPRSEISISGLNELADSIKQVGLLEPIIVRPEKQAVGQFEVVVGERRYRACQQAGVEMVPVVVCEVSDEQVLELNLIENIQREDLTAVEKGRCCKQLLEKYVEKYPSREALAKRIGVSSDTVNNWLRLTGAPAEIQQMVAPTSKVGVPRRLGKLDYSTALTITRQIGEPKRQIEAAREIALKPVHGRQARRVVAEAAAQPMKPVKEIIEEIIEEPCELIFLAAEKEPILRGSKRQTTRTEAPDARIKTGTIVHATISEPQFADLHVVSVERKRLKHFTENDAKFEGGMTLDEFRKMWTDKHGDWDENQLVHLIRFEKA